MIELFDNPREDKKSDRPAPKSLVKFRQIYQDAMAGAGEEKNKAQKAKGKFTARERLSYLLDRDSFFEIKSLVESNCHDFGVAEKHIKGDGGRLDKHNFGRILTGHSLRRLELGGIESQHDGYIDSVVFYTGIIVRVRVYMDRRKARSKPYDGSVCPRSRLCSYLDFHEVRKCRRRRSFSCAQASLAHA